MALTPATSRSAGRRIPWRRLWAMAAPTPWPLAAMFTLTAIGSLAGLVVPLALGSLVDRVAAHRGAGSGALDLAAMGGATIVTFVAFVLSDGLYARIAGRLFARLRCALAAAPARERADRSDAEHAAGVLSRLLSDAETVEEMTVGMVDVVATSAVTLVVATIALLALSPVAALALLATALVSAPLVRRLQRPAEDASERRQEALEQMSRALPTALRGAADRFTAAVEAVRRAEIHLGWWEALNRHGSGGLAAIAPVCGVLVAGLHGGVTAGTLVSIFLLAERVSQSVDELADASLAVAIARGPVLRCLALVDGAPSRPLVAGPLVVRQAPAPGL